ncbi:MAG: GNAT family N-acetyltransferase, partial [Candidatus Eisenbacteria bacterium]|nr:GNAT family N-acetyltransferase [Candidatus Eisenbacteria bacterium]
VGGLLVDAMITWAKASSIVTKINLRVSPDNPRGLALYAKKGFVREGQISRDMLIDGKYSESIWMGLEL